MRRRKRRRKSGHCGDHCDCKPPKKEERERESTSRVLDVEAAAVRLHLGTNKPIKARFWP